MLYYGILRCRNTTTSSYFHKRETYLASKSIKFQGLFLDARDEDNFTPLLCAAWKGQTEAGRTLLRYGADIQALDKETKSCLHWAVEMQHCDFVKMLFEHGHEGDEIIDWRDRDEQTALHYAAEVGSVKVFCC